MLGATGPLPIAGTLASGTAEDLAGIALAQMVRPGTPVVLGMQSNAMDMKGMIFACGSPEGALMQAWGARGAKGSAYIEENIDKEMARMLEAHAQHGPKLDDDLKARVREVLMKETGISAQQLDAIEAL